MNIVVHQPQVFPRLHLVQRYALADIVVVMDLAQVNRKVGMASYELRDSKWNDLHVLGEEQFTTYKVPLTGGHRVSCHDARVSGGDWKRKQLRALAERYAGAAWLPSALSVMEVTVRAGERFGDVGVGQVNAVFGFGLAGITLGRQRNAPQVVLESDLIGTWRKPLDGSDRVLEIVKLCGGKRYLCGKPESRSYLREADFASSGIEVWSQDFVPPKAGDVSWLHYYVVGGPKGLEEALGKL